MEKNIGKKEKWTNKGTDKQYAADSLIFFNTRYNLSYPMFLSNFKILGQVVAEKSLTKKKVYTHTDTQKKQKLYTPYILRIPGV